MFVITGPSGVGKGTLIRGLLSRVPSLELSVSATTRAPRPGEVDGVDYHFLTQTEFERRIEEGARQVRQAMPEAIAVFISPPSRDALRTRLVGRGTDSAEQVEERMRTAERELLAQPEFGHVVVNDRLEDATDELERIVRTALGQSPGIA